MNDFEKILSLLKYTTTSKKGYSGKYHDTGYHTLKINETVIEGQRNPSERFELVKYDFKNKKVLDLGSNQGGMLFEISNLIEYGIGIDYDYRLINVSTKISKYKNLKNIDFYCFDLEKDPLDLILSLSDYNYFDIIFLLSVCMWIKNWQEVIKWTYNHADSCLFETNGTDNDQYEQYLELKKYFKTVEMIYDKSMDDKHQKNRKLYICKK